VVPVGDDLYYFSMKYNALENGEYYIPEEMTNGLIPAGNYIIKDYKITFKNGIYEEGGKLYYYEDNVKQKAGVVATEDGYYYFSMKYHALENGVYTITAEMTNGLIPAGEYLIEDYKIVIKNGVYEEHGKLYYYVDNVKVKAGAVQVGDDIYYFSMKYYALADGTYTIPEEMTNGLIPAGKYTIKDGKIVL
ncbi:MAG: hypothetical protein J6B24_08235, partial [Clostridia bacterium]|nr:hypothetical protein [Clostridia bacterium]